VTIERQDVGIELRMRPTLGQAGSIHLEIELDSTAVIGSATSLSAGAILQQRRLDTTVQLSNGGIALIAGARGPRTERIERGIPWLKDLPWLGIFFRETIETEQESQLLISVQASVVTSPEERIANSIRGRLGFERTLERTAGLAPGTSGTYAVRIATLERRDDAEALQQANDVRAFATDVVRWRATGGELFDVYATGFGSIGEASAAAATLHDLGWSPELIAIPARIVEAVR
jgi:Flp pilus assembly secretin CpaC